jgi:hypothetical protein
VPFLPDDIETLSAANPIQDAATNLPADLKEPSAVQDERPFLPTFMQSVGLAGQQDWAAPMTGDFFARLYAHTEDWDERADYDPFNDPQTAGREKDAYAFMNSYSPGQTRMILDRVDRFNARQEQLAENGWAGFAGSLVAGAVDPVAWGAAMMATPVGAAAYRLGRGGWAGWAAAGAVEGAAFSAPMALTRPLEDMSWTVEDTLFTLGSGALLGGLLGPGLGLAGKAGFKGTVDQWARELEEEILAQTAPNTLRAGDTVHWVSDTDIPLNQRQYTTIKEIIEVDGKSFAKVEGSEKLIPLGDLEYRITDADRAAFEAKRSGAVADDGGAPTMADVMGGTSGQSASAAAVDTSTLADNTLKTAILPKYLATWGPVKSPVISPFFRMSNQARRVMRRLSSVAGLRFIGDAKRGAPLSVEEAVKVWRGSNHLLGGIMATDQAFVKYRGLEGKAMAQTRAGISDMASNVTGGGKMMSRKEFDEQVGRAMENNDQHAIKEVAEAAAAWRKMVADPLYNDAVSLGMIEKTEREIADSYFRRHYSIKDIKARRFSADGQSGFQEIIEKWLAQTRDAARALDPAEREGWVKSLDAARKLIDEIPEKWADKDQLGKGVFRQIRRIEGEIKRKTAMAEAYRKVLDRVDREHEYAQTRAERAKPTGKLAPDDPLVYEIGNARDYANGRLREPVRLADEVRRRGGIIDTGGDLAAAGLKSTRYRRGVIATEGKGMQADIMLKDLVSEGWLDAKMGPDGTWTQDDLNELFNKIIEDTGPDGGKSSTPVYNEIDDAAQIAEYRRAISFADEIERAGGNFSMPDEQIAYMLGAIDEYKANTAVTRERSRGADYYLRRVRENMDYAVKQYVGAKDRVKELELKKLDKLTLLNLSKGDALVLDNELKHANRTAAKMRRRIDAHDQLVQTEDGDFRDIASQIVDKIIGVSGRPSYDAIPIVGKSLKEITLTIPSKMIADFLDYNVERVMSGYVRQMSADVELFRQFGSIDLKNETDAIRAEYVKLMTSERTRIREEMTKAGKSQAEIDRAVEKSNNKLNKELKDNVDDVEYIRDRLRHMSDLPNDPAGIVPRLVQNVKKLNAMRLGGGFTTASLPDWGSAASVHGTMRLIGMDNLMGFITGINNVKLNGKEVKVFGTGVDYGLETRANALVDVLDDTVGDTMLERGIDYAHKKFYKFNLLSQWTTGIKTMLGVASLNRNLDMLEAVVKGTISKSEMERLNSLGLGQEWAEEIVNLSKKHGTWKDGEKWANTAAWENREAAARLGAAVTKEVDAAIVSPGLERTRWITTQGGSLLGQFRSFTMSSSLRVTSRMMQQRDVNAFSGFMQMVALGMLAYRLKVPEERRAPVSEWQVWLKEGIDRSGALGWLFEANNMIEKLSYNRAGLSSLLGQQATSRFHNRGFISTVAGPTAGLLEDAYSVALGAAADRPMTQAERKKGLNMVPYAGLFYLRWGADLASEQSGDAK